MKKSILLLILASFACGPINIPTPVPCDEGKKPSFDPFTGRWTCVDIPTPPPTPVPPTPVPTVTPTPGPIPTPTPSCSFPQGLEESQFEPIFGLNGSSTAAQVRAAVEAVLARLNVTCEGDDCPVIGLNRDEWYAEIAAELRSQGLCAGRHRDAPPASDEIAVGICTDPYDCIFDGWHLGSCSDATGTCKPGFPVPGSNSYTGSTRIRKSTLVPCPTGSWLIHIDVKHLNGILFDATAGIHNREYCSAVWSGDNYDVNKQVMCELGQPDTKQRECELLPRWHWTFNGEPREVHNGNPFLMMIGREEKGEAKICNSDNTVCATAVVE